MKKFTTRDFLYQEEEEGAREELEEEGVGAEELEHSLAWLAHKALEYTNDDEGLRQAKKNYPSLDEEEIRQILSERHRAHAEFTAQSSEVLSRGLERLQTMLDERPRSGNLLGVLDATDFQGGYRSWTVKKIDPDNPDSRRGVLNFLASGNPDRRPVFDNEVFTVAHDSGSGSQETIYLGHTELCGYGVSYNRSYWPQGSHFSIFGEDVTNEDYNIFSKNLRNLAACIDPQVENRLSADDQRTIKTMKMNAVLNNAVNVQAGPVELKSIYRSQHFGSGGGYGSVSAYNLSSWRNGIKKPIDLTTDGAVDNGFMSGPSKVVMQPDMLIVAKGGDAIGKGRTWCEYYYCEAEGHEEV